MMRLTVPLMVLAGLFAGCQQGSPPSLLLFAGPDSGRVGDTLSFRVVARDPDYDMVTFKFEWGDGSTSQWTPFFQPYDTVVRNWVYAEAGTFYARVKVRDVERNESDWSESLHVRVR